MSKPKTRNKRRTPEPRAAKLAARAIEMLKADESEIAGDLNPTRAAMGLLYEAIDALHPSPAPPAATDGTPRPLAAPGMLATVIDVDDFHFRDVGVISEVYDAGAAIQIAGAHGPTIKEFKHLALVNPQADPAHLKNNVQRQCAAALAASLDVANHLLHCIDRLTREVHAVFEDNGPVGIAGADKRHDDIANHLDSAVELLWNNVGILAGSLNPPLALALSSDRLPAALPQNPFASAMYRAMASCPQLKEQPPAAQPIKAEGAQAVAASQAA